MNTDGCRGGRSAEASPSEAPRVALAEANLNPFRSFGVQRNGAKTRRRNGKWTQPDPRSSSLEAGSRQPAAALSTTGTASLFVPFVSFVVQRNRYGLGNCPDALVRGQTPHPCPSVFIRGFPGSLIAAMHPLHEPLHEPGRGRPRPRHLRFMAPEQVQMDQAALHEPGRGRARLLPSRRTPHLDPARQEPRPTEFMVTAPGLGAKGALPNRTA